ncbi:MAG: flagellin lysine-N-methylase [Eubacteriales bacterium]|nr:flagellin lysine-N-methylase [Eubacteriales bacterium]
MNVTKPDYFDRFRCLAGSCPDSCCKEWEVHVDHDTAALYQKLPGALGDNLRRVLREEDGEVYMTICDGRCPMWRRDGLCRIQAELGETALCKTCREFPRLTHDYGDFVELGLELSCPEAARLILNEPTVFVTEEVPGDGKAEYDRDAMEILIATRERALELLDDSGRPIGDTLALLLLFGCQAQSELDGGEAAPFDPDTALEATRELAQPGDAAEILSFFQSLEILTAAWDTRLHSPAPAGWDSRTLALSRYFVSRYWLQAVSDYDLYSRVKFMAIACLLLRQLGGDFVETSQLFSKEIENDADNMDALLDAAYEHPAFTDAKLLGMLLG